jgi:hypothetical protein
MFIRERDYDYFLALHGSLDQDRQKRFMAQFLKALKAKTGEDFQRATRVATDKVLDEQGIEPEEWVTRTMIKKVYKEVKGSSAGD